MVLKKVVKAMPLLKRKWEDVPLMLAPPVAGPSCLSGPFHQSSNESLSGDK